MDFFDTPGEERIAAMMESNFLESTDEEIDPEITIEVVYESST